MSTNDLMDTARRVVEAARKRGAQGSRAYATQRRSTTLEWRDGRLDRVRESTERSVGVSLYVDGRYSSNQTSDLRPDALAKFLDDCLAMTRVLAPDPARVLPDPQRYRDRSPADLRVMDAGGLTPEARQGLVREMEEGARGVPGADRVLSVSGSASDERLDSALIVSNGMEATRSSTSYGIGVEVSVRDDGERKPEGWWQAETCLRNRLPSAIEGGREAARRALAELGAKPDRTGSYPCVVENRVVSRLLSGLLRPLAGAMVQQRQSFFAGRIGESFGSPLLSITDEPLLAEGLASRPYDSEGMSLKALPLFEGGVLRNLYLDTYYAMKLGVSPTTGTTTNLIFPTGTRSLDQLLAGMGRGILVTGFNGGNSNPAAGNFSLGVRGFWVEGGRPVRPLVEMNLSGNHVDFWKGLVELGNDPNPYSSTRSPSLRFEKVQFSGT